MTKITITVDISNSDIEAAAAAYNINADPASFTAEDVKLLYLERAAQAKLHELRSRHKWNQYKIYEKLPKEQGLRLTSVFDKAGKHYDVMLPADYEVTRQVISPREGVQCCTHPGIDWCWYDHRHDPAWDSCVFCGNPHERK